MGARPNGDGIDAIHTHMTNTMNTPMVVDFRLSDYPMLKVKKKWHPTRAQVVEGSMIRGGAMALCERYTLWMLTPEAEVALSIASPLPSILPCGVILLTALRRKSALNPRYTCGGREGHYGLRGGEVRDNRDGNVLISDGEAQPLALRQSVYFYTRRRYYSG